MAKFMCRLMVYGGVEIKIFYHWQTEVTAIAHTCLWTGNCKMVIHYFLKCEEKKTKKK
jgi:hypothetical protein